MLDRFIFSCYTEYTDTFVYDTCMKGGSPDLKRFFAFCSTVLFASCILTACGDQPDSSQTAASAPTETSQTETTNKSSKSSKETDDTIMVTLHDGATVPICDAKSEVIETEDGYQWSFCDGNCSLTFPKSWESRFIIRGMTVYSLACFERAEVCSSLFSVEVRPAEKAAAEPYPALILGLSGNDYLCGVYPDAGEPSNSVLKREYHDLAADCNSILNTAVCKNSLQFKPLSTDTYTPVYSDMTSDLFGKWITRTTKNGILDEEICFHEDGTLTFTSAGTVSEGSCLFNIYTATFDWNDPNNWGETALIFLNGGIYSATYYKTEPYTLDFKPVQLPPDQKNPLDGTVFAFVS